MMAGILYFSGRIDLRMYERLVVVAAAFCTAARASGKQLDGIKGGVTGREHTSSIFQRDLFL